MAPSTLCWRGSAGSLPVRSVRARNGLSDVSTEPTKGKVRCASNYTLARPSHLKSCPLHLLRAAPGALLRALRGAPLLFKTAKLHCTVPPPSVLHCLMFCMCNTLPPFERPCGCAVPMYDVPSPCLSIYFFSLHLRLHAYAIPAAGRLHCALCCHVHAVLCMMSCSQAHQCPLLCITPTTRLLILPALHTALVLRAFPCSALARP